MSPLSGLTRLATLDLGHTAVMDVSPLVNLTNLHRLHLDGCPLESTRTLQRMGQLNQLTIDGIQASDEELDELRKALPNRSIRFRERK